MSMNSFNVDFDLVKPMVVIGSSDIDELQAMLADLPNTEYTEEQKQTLENHITERIDFLIQFTEMTSAFEQAKREVDEMEKQRNAPVIEKRRIGFVLDYK